MKKKIETLTILCVLVIVSAISGCQARKKTIVTNLTTYPKDQQLDPSTVKFIQEYNLLDNISGKLMSLGKGKQYDYDLAKKISFSKDKKTVSIILKPNLKFSDGSPLTAHDVAFSLKRVAIAGGSHSDIKKLWVGSEHLKSIQDDIPGIVVKSNSELVLKLKTRSTDLFFYFSLADFAVLHKSQYLKSEKIIIEDWVKVSSGAYKISYNENGHVILSANRHSHQYSSSIPQKVVLNNHQGKDVLKGLQDKTLDFGIITFAQYVKYLDEIENAGGYKIWRENVDGVVHLTLNSKKGVFKDPEIRRWINKKMISALTLPTKYKKVAQKAIVYFLPNAKSGVSAKEIDHILRDVDISSVPKALASGITIKVMRGMKFYMPERLEETLADQLGIPVKFEMIENHKFVKDVLEEKKFDSFLIASELSYRRPSEPIVSKYLSEKPFVNDPSGSIKKMINSYRKGGATEDQASVLNQIIKQIAADSELIPMFYISSPYFLKNESLKVKSLDVSETIQFSRMETL